MNREEFQTERTRIISEMLDNPDEYGIYPTTKCFEQLDALFDSLSLPPAEGADPKKVQWSGYGPLGNISQKPLQPTAEGADEILADELNLDRLSPLQYNGIIRAMNKFATLHAQRIADKMVSERLREELIKYDTWVGKYKWVFDMRTAKEAVDEYLKSKEK